MTETTTEPASTNAAASETTPSTFWADAGIVLVHLGVIVYPLWLMLWRVPEYVKLLEKFKTPLTPEAKQFAGISAFWVSHLIWSLPLCLLLFLGFEIWAVKKSENQGWRKIWLIGMVLVPFAFSAWVQSTFFLLLNNLSS